MGNSTDFNINFGHFPKGLYITYEEKQADLKHDMVETRG